MELDDLHPVDDYSHRFFIWHEWIQAKGPLTADNVFDYFATSMFYDKQSNNQVLRMQTMHTGQPILNEAEELKRFTGIEFALMHAVPPSLFIIHKRERLSPEEVRPLAAYFIMNNRIYQSPDVYTVISNRLLTSLHSLQSSLDTLRIHRPDFTPRTGFIWPVVEPPAAEAPNKKHTAGEDHDGNLPDSTAATMKSNVPTPTGTKKQQNFLPLFNAMRTTAAHSSTSFALRASESVPPELIPTDHTSATQAPTRDATPKAASRSTPILQDPNVKPPLGGGKKKKKRLSLSPDRG